MQNYSSPPNYLQINNDKTFIKNNIENHIKTYLIPKYFEGREYSYKISKWQQNFLDELENYCLEKYPNYKFYFWLALYPLKGLLFNSSGKVHYYKETDMSFSFYIRSTNIGIDLHGIGIKNKNLDHKGSINDYKSDLRNKIDNTIENIFEGRTIMAGKCSKYLDFILDEILKYCKLRDNFPYYYIVGTIFKKGIDKSISERYFNQTSNYGVVSFNYQNNSIECAIHVFSCL